MGPRVLSVRHGDEPLDDRATNWLERSGYIVDTRRPFRGEALGAPGDDLAATIVYGGPYNACETDRHPFLRDEYRWIDACMSAGVKVLGICQGAQMIAHHCGAWAGARETEIFEFGYYEIVPTEAAGDFLARPLTVCQAHFHTFDLPDGAERLAANDNYENQAFRLGESVYGLQFHAEVTEPGFRRWQAQKAEAYGRPGAQSRAEQDRLLTEHDAAQGLWFEGFLDRFIGVAS
ncbi:glutamine amidotransferase-related protein [Ovoidimarina sediminis]|uniref:glutamine amidotransferase-related protein n=1 Tax=Ovoidimarina sediminis TaxID=3079856 RepID=UPI0029138083|nr:glutamine amidotransferase [Rhodophyticola sp. MJ-SS7]MDU8943566.1 glutamine amidotransferase [Rhodophyticola sp. MJ-SS7]